jgi:hypothetical protein
MGTILATFPAGDLSAGPMAMAFDGAHVWVADWETAGENSVGGVRKF